MRGHVAKKGERYYTVVDIGPDPDTGKRRQRWQGGHRTRKEAERSLTEILRSLDRGEYIEPSRETVKEFSEEWLRAITATVRPSTYASYKAEINKHVIPTLGGIRLRDVTGPRLNALYAELLKNGRRSGQGGLSPTTVRYIHTLIHRMMRDAVRWGRLTRNPADVADPPGRTKTEMSVWDASEVQQFLRSVADERLHPLYVLALTTGMRRGELLGLRWIDVDFDGGRLAITRSLIAIGYDVQISEPKTARSRRSISLDVGTIAILRSWRRTQLEERLAWGPAFEDSGLVFTREDGSAIHPHSISKTFQRHAKDAAVPPIRFHDLRHTSATLALAAGEHPRVVADRLGHSSIAITLDTYSHVLPSMQEAAAIRIGELVHGG